jgi:hypothetical protein
LINERFIAEALAITRRIAMHLESKVATPGVLETVEENQPRNAEQ